jgi:hypothetical protein
MSKYKRVGDLPSGTYFRGTDDSSDSRWFRVRRQVEAYAEVQRVEENGDIPDTYLLGALTMVVPLSIARA